MSSVSCVFVVTVVNKYILYLCTRKLAVSYAAQGLNASAISRVLATEGLPYSSSKICVSATSKAKGWTNYS